MTTKLSWAESYPDYPGSRANSLGRTARPGVGTMTCALRGPGGEALGALVAAGLGFEKDLHADSKLAQHLARAAKNVSSQLGHA